MKKTVLALLIAAVMVMATACSPQQIQSSDAPDGAQISEVPEPVVAFTDPVLEELVRKAMNRPEGDITMAEAEAVTELNLEMNGNDWSSPRIADVSDLKQFPNLTGLTLNWALLYNGDEMFDISPLASLTKLERLYLCCTNVSDINALAGMTDMKDLWIWGNHITDISALAGMTQMESLWMKTNQIADISAPAGMKDLVYLYMENNQVTDLSPLAGLSKLTHVLLSGNPATDYSPLADVYPNLEEKDFQLK